MSGHPTTMIARGIRLSMLCESARDTAVSPGAILSLWAVDVHFCALNGTKA
ncbi:MULTISPECIES: hypothetical protein [Mesorhizobium]|nr:MULTISPECIES: hypothetical protein [Mesorhizobium]